MKRVKVRYFAVFREKAGVSCEEVETSAADLALLYEELASRYAFHLSPNEVKASLNTNWVGLDSRFGDGDEIVFIPPVAGG